MRAAFVRMAPAAKIADSPWITVKEAAVYLHVSVDAIYDACSSKGLKHVELGHSTIRLKRAWVDEWAESQVRR